MYLKRINGDLIGEGESIKEIATNNKANLLGADLLGADLREADLRGANLRGADLQEANLRGAKRHKWILKINPIQINSLKYFVIIFGEHMEIGCENHSFEDWYNFENDRIIRMDVKSAMKFWEENKYTLLPFCEQQSEKHVKAV